MAQAPVTRPSLLVRLRDQADGPAWTQFVEIYAPLIYGSARKQGLQDADAGDLTQDVLQAVARSIRGLDYDPQRGSFRGWLFTLVRNKLRTFLERQSRGVRGSGDTTAMEALQQQPAPVADEEAWWEEESERRMFAWAAEQIRPTVEEKTWQAFWQAAVEGKHAKDIAAELGLTVAAVYMAKSRTLARFKELIQQVVGQDSNPDQK